MVSLLIEYDIGVVRTSYDLIELQEVGEWPQIASTDRILQQLREQDVIAVLEEGGGVPRCMSSHA